MVALFGRILKTLPFLGVACIVTATLWALRAGQMDQQQMALTVFGFALFLAMFLRIEAASLRYYLNLGVLSVLMLANLALVQMLTLNHPRQWDLTRNARYSLSPETRQVIRGLPQPVHITALAPENEPYFSYLSLYARESDRLTFEIRNPYQRSAEDEAPGEVEINDLLIASGDRSTRISYQAGGDLWQLEREIVNGLLSVSQDDLARLYFLTRHGEKTLDPPLADEGAGASISAFGRTLVERAYDVRALDLRADRYVPDDCAVLCIIGPATDLREDEAAAVRAYLDRGGALFVAVDPPASEAQRRPELTAVLRERGLEVVEQYVLDYESHSDEYGVYAPMVYRFNDMHPITEKLQGVGGELLLNQACAVERARSAPKDLLVEALLLTTPKSWLVPFEAYRLSRRTGKLDSPPSEEWRPIGLAAAVGPKGEREPGEEEEPRIAVYGDSDFLSDAQFSTLEATLGYFTVSWLAGSADRIAVPPREPDRTPLYLKPAQRNLISIFSVVVLPSAVFFGGLVYTTVRRRKR